jgi:hypothetical protein
MTNARHIHVIISLLFAAALAALPHPALASMPVEYAMVGCIKDGKFQLRSASGPRMDDPAIAALEGKTVRVEGLLSPGDGFHANAILVVDDACREDLHKTYFLCDPCQTLPNMPPSRPAPRKEDAKPVDLTPAAIALFNQLPRALRGR